MHARLVRKKKPKKVQEPDKPQQEDDPISTSYSLLVEPSTRYYLSKGNKGTDIQNNRRNQQWQPSAKVEPKFGLGTSREGFTFNSHLFYRHDNIDTSRKHYDAREVLARFKYDSLEFRVGIGKEFWGVLETENIVDIINQDDFVEDITGREKLGQPMTALAIAATDNLALDFLVLPYFRERTFPSKESRLAGSLEVNPGESTYESKDKERHTDYAARASGYIEDLELGISYFRGTSRDPEFRAIVSDPADPAPTIELAPHYPQIEQYGLSLQYNLSDWTLKSESIARLEKSGDHSVYGAGLEYNLYGIFDSQADLGLILEQFFDDRTDRSIRANQNDIVFGVRVTLNDVDSTEITMGIAQDLEFGSAVGFGEISSGSQGRYLATLRYRGILAPAKRDILTYDVRDSSFLELALGIYIL